MRAITKYEVEEKTTKDAAKKKKNWSEIVSVVERSAPCKVPLWCRHNRMHENTFLRILATGLHSSSLVEQEQLVQVHCKRKVTSCPSFCLNLHGFRVKLLCCVRVQKNQSNAHSRVQNATDLFPGFLAVSYPSLFNQVKFIKRSNLTVGASDLS